MGASVILKDVMYGLHRVNPNSNTEFKLICMETKLIIQEVKTFFLYEDEVVSSFEINYKDILNIHIETKENIDYEVIKKKGSPMAGLLGAAAFGTPGLLLGLVEEKHVQKNVTETKFLVIKTVDREIVFYLPNNSYLIRDTKSVIKRVNKQKEKIDNYEILFLDIEKGFVKKQEDTSIVTRYDRRSVSIKEIKLKFFGEKVISSLILDRSSINSMNFEIEERINPDTGENAEVGLIKIKSIDNEVVLKTAYKGNFYRMEEFVRYFYA